MPTYRNIKNKLEEHLEFEFIELDENVDDIMSKLGATGDVNEAVYGSTEKEPPKPEEEEEAPTESKKLKKEDLEIDVKDDIDAITNGEDLSEDFKSKASTIFEAAVSAKVLSEVNQRVEKLEEDYKKEIKLGF